MLVYKILLPKEWELFAASGRFDGSPFDAESGFIHFSSRPQLTATAQRFFANEPSFVVVALDEESLGARLRWELASNGELFPHVYDSIATSEVVAVYEVPGAGGVEECL